MKIWAFIFSYFIFGVVRAETLEVPIQPESSFIIKGNDVSLVFKTNKSANWKINFPASEWEVSTLKAPLIEIKQTATKTSRKVIEIQGPAIAGDIFLGDGNIQLGNWTESLRVTMVRGVLQSQKGKGNWKINLQRGQVSLLNHQGSITADLGDTQTQIVDLEGDLQLEQMSGDLNLDRISGSHRVRATTASVKCQKSKGTLSFELGRGSAVIGAFQGNVEGETNEGPVQVQLANESDLKIKSHSGKVTVTTAGVSGVYVNASTQEGDLLVPSELKVERDAFQKTARGRLRADSGKGNIHIRSIEGAVVIR